MKSKIVAFVSAIALFSSITTVVMPMSAAATDLPVEFKLEYDADASTSTTRAINLYYDGRTLKDFSSIQFKLNYSTDAVASATVSHDVAWNNSASCADWSSIGYYAYTVNMKGGVYADIPTGKIATFELTVPEGTGEFEVYIDELEAYSSELDADYTMGNCWYYSSGENADFNNNGRSALIIPAWSTGGDTKDDFTEAAATKGSRYDEHTNTVPVDAWSTKIDWSKYNAVAKLFWSISNGSETKKVEATMAEVTGDIDAEVTYGLAIAGQADELNTITEVKLVVE